MKTFKTPKGTELPLRDLKGKDYLDVKWRILWFSEEKSDWSIHTELIEKNDKHVTMKASIYDEKLVLRAQSHKCNPWGEHELESSETGAIGRALALLGYGTQFTGDELSEKERIADAPVEFAPIQKSKPATKAPAPPVKNHAPQATNMDVASPAQQNMFWGKVEENGWGEKDIKDLFAKIKVETFEKATKKQASELIGIVKDSSPALYFEQIPY